MRKLKLIKAFCEAFDEEMQRDERVCLFGEDVGEYGGVFGTSQKLQSKYGHRRVFDTPLSECAILGTAVGGAMTGLRPIAELMYMDFVTVAMDPLINQCAKLRFMSGGQFSLPLVIFAQFGSGTSEAAQHSQSLEAWFMHTPGLKVAMPSTVYDAKGLMKSSIRDDDPVIFLWHRMMYDLVEEVPDETCMVPLGQATVRRTGEDVTVVATSNMVPKAIEASESLSDEMGVEVIDPRTIVPLDIDTILNSVVKTGRLLVVHEANTCGGFGAELVRQVIEKCYNELVCPPKVLGQIGVPMPFSPILEQACLPQVHDIVRTVRQMLRQRQTV